MKISPCSDLGIMPLTKVVGYTLIMKEKFNLFSSFLLKILRKLALKVAIYERQTDRNTGSSKIS